MAEICNTFSCNETHFRSICLHIFKYIFIYVYPPAKLAIILKISSCKECKTDIRDVIEKVKSIDQKEYPRTENLSAIVKHFSCTDNDITEYDVCDIYHWTLSHIFCYQNIPFFICQDVAFNCNNSMIG